MNSFIILATLVAAAYGEAPISGGYSGGGGGAISAGRNFAFGGSSGGGGGSGLNEYVDQALLNRVAEVIASGGSPTGQDNEGSRYVDAALLARVAGSLGGSGGGRVSSEYGAPAPGGQPSLGQPEPAQRIAEWDLSETRQSTGGGYSGPVPQPQGGYDAPSRSSGGRQSSGGAITLGQPETAQRVAEFEVADQQQSQASRNTNGGYQ